MGLFPVPDSCLSALPGGIALVTAGPIAGRPATSALARVTPRTDPFQPGTDLARPLQTCLLRIVPTTRERVMPDLAAVLAPNASAIGGGPTKPTSPGAPSGTPGDGRPADFADHLALATGQGQAAVPAAPPPPPGANPVPPDAEWRQPGVSDGINRVGDTPFWPMPMPANGIEVMAEEPTDVPGDASDMTEDDPAGPTDHAEAGALDATVLTPIVDCALPVMPDPTVTAGAVPVNQPPASPTDVLADDSDRDRRAALATTAPSDTAQAARTPSFPVRPPGPDAASALLDRGFEQPAITDPKTPASGSEPGRAEAGSASPRSGGLDAAPAQPGATQPGTIQPGATHPGTTQPGATRAGATRAGATLADASPAGTNQAGTLPAGTMPTGTIPDGATQAGTTPSAPDAGNPAPRPGQASDASRQAADQAARRAGGEIAAQGMQADLRADDSGTRRAAVEAARDATEAAQTTPDPTNQAMTAPFAPDAPDRSSPTAEPRSASTPADQIATRVAPVLVRIDPGATGGQRLTIRLDPEELGQVEVRIERPEPLTARVHILVERPETLALLRRDQAALERALDDAGVGTQARDVVFDLADPAPTTTVPSAAATDSRQDPPSRQDTPRFGAETFATMADHQGDRRSGQGDGRDRAAYPGSAGMDRFGPDPLSGSPGAALAESGAWRRPGLNITA